MVVLVILNEVKKEAPLPARNLSDEFIIEEINSYLKVSDSVDSQNRKAKEVIFYTFERLKNHQYIAISNFHDTYNGDVALLPAGERVLDMKVEGFENRRLGSNIKSALRFVASASVSPSIKVILDKLFG